MVDISSKRHKKQGHSYIPEFLFPGCCNSLNPMVFGMKDNGLKTMTIMFVKTGLDGQTN